MGDHYAGCRPGNCAGCGQPESLVWNCGRRGCGNYHAWLKENNPKEYQALMKELQAGEETAVLERIRKRNRESHEANVRKEKEKILRKRQKIALAKLTRADRKALGLGRLGQCKVKSGMLFGSPRGSR